jgi:YegS/Rv2252/BmrU family lipid kinase
LKIFKVECKIKQVLFKGVRKMQSLLIINPEARLGISKREQNAIIKMAKKILNKNIEVFLVNKEKKNEIKEIDFEVVILCGGDGTLNQFLNLAGRNFKIGLIPLGSGVDFAASLGIPKNIRRAFEIIKEGRIKLVDLGMVNGRIFANTVSFGFDAFINQLQAEKIRPKMKKLKSILPFRIDAKWAYVVALLYFLFPGVYFDPPLIQISNDYYLFWDPIHFLAITNSFRYGGGFRINPYAKMDDGYLDACKVLPLSKLEVLKNIYPTRKGSHILNPKVSFFQFKRLIVESKVPLNVQVDGELLPSQSYFEISVIEKALKVFVP